MCPSGIRTLHPSPRVRSLYGLLASVAIACNTHTHTRICHHRLRVHGAALHDIVDCRNGSLAHDNVVGIVVCIYTEALTRGVGKINVVLKSKSLSRSDAFGALLAID